MDTVTSGRCIALVGVLACACLAWPRSVHAGQQGTADLKRMSLEQLLEIEVSTVTRRPEQTGDVPAALFVITGDDIRRSGATSLPEALRLAPGLQAAQLDGGKWATGIRGFADRLSRAMLVLIDGRAVYSPLFAGTYWEVQDLMLEDIDPIEVIRGPGGTLWGANAVNGIINIVRKPASTTQGVLASAERGTFGHVAGGARVGGQSADGTLAYRFYGRAIRRAQEYQDTGTPYAGTRTVQAGGRADWRRQDGRLLTVQGDAYRVMLGQVAVRTSYVSPFRETDVVDSPLSGGNVLARMSRAAGAGRGFQLQAFYDRTVRRETPIGEVRDTVDLDYQQTERPWGRHRLAFGGGYRVTSGLIAAVAPSAILPPRRTDNLFTAFLQDEIRLAGDRLRASLGTKVEHNAYSGFVAQPSARLLWSPAADHTVFVSVTRAARTPSRVETDYTTTSLSNPAMPSFVRLVPNPGFRPETLVAYEAGYRVRPGARAYLTVSTFYNRLDDVLSTEFVRSYSETVAPGPPHTVLEVMFRNGLFGHAYGAELTADVRPIEIVRGTVNYAWSRTVVTRDPGAIDVSQERRYEGITPRHQFQAQAAVDLPFRLALDVSLRHVSALAAGPVAAYTTASVRLGWQASERVEIALVGQDVNRARHQEWPGGLLVQRSVVLKATFRQP
ncbi:MAG: TonB-dependent receptor plug domain-containing protein [Vicinamibacterales bacterium]